MVRVNIIQGEASRKRRKQKDAKKQPKVEGHSPRHKLKKSSSWGQRFSAYPPEGLGISDPSHPGPSTSSANFSPLPISVIHQTFQPSEPRTPAATITNHQNDNFMHPVKRYVIQLPLYQTAQVMITGNRFTAQPTPGHPALVTGYPNLITGQNGPYCEEGQAINEVHMRHFHPDCTPQPSKSRCNGHANINSSVSSNCKPSYTVMTSQPSMQQINLIPMFEAHAMSPYYQKFQSRSPMPSTSVPNDYQVLPLTNSGIQPMPNSEGASSDLIEAPTVGSAQYISPDLPENDFAELLSDFISQLPDELLEYAPQEPSEDSPKDVNGQLPEATSADSPKDLSDLSSRGQRFPAYPPEDLGISYFSRLPRSAIHQTFQPLEPRTPAATITNRQNDNFMPLYQTAQVMNTGNSSSSQGVSSDLVKYPPVDSAQYFSAGLPENDFAELLSDFISQLPDELLEYAPQEHSEDSPKHVNDQLPEATAADSPQDLSESFSDLLADFFGFPKDHFVDVCPTMSDSTSDDFTDNLEEFCMNLTNNDEFLEEN